MSRRYSVDAPSWSCRALPIFLTKVEDGDDVSHGEPKWRDNHGDKGSYLHYRDSRPEKAEDLERKLEEASPRKVHAPPQPQLRCWRLWRMGTCKAS